MRKLINKLNIKKQNFPDYMLQNHYSLFGFKLKSELHELYLVEAVRSLSILLVWAFLPIFLYEKTIYGIFAIFIFFLVTRILGLFLSPLVGEIISRKGLRFVFVSGAFLHILLYISIALIPFSTIFFWIFLLIDAFRNHLWFMGQNTDVSIEASKGNAAYKLVGFKVIYSIISIITPILAAYIITSYGFGNLYIFAAVLAFFTFILSFILGETQFPNYNFPSIKVIKRTLNNSVYSYRTVLNILWGFRAVIATGVWPLILYLTLKDIKSIGWLTTLILLTITILSISISKKIDKHPEKTQKYLSNGMISEGLSWIGKIGAFNIFTLFITDTITQVGSQFVENSLNKMNYGTSKKAQIALEEMTERELAISLGHIIAAFVVIVLCLMMDEINALKFSIVILGVITIGLSFAPKVLRRKKSTNNKTTWPQI